MKANNLKKELHLSISRKIAEKLDNIIATKDIKYSDIARIVDRPRQELYSRLKGVQCLTLTDIFCYCEAIGENPIPIIQEVYSDFLAQRVL